MKRGTKLGLILGGSILVLAAVVIIGAAAFFLSRVSSGTERARATFKKQTAETVGTITNVSVTTSMRVYTYTYVVNGASYSGTYMVSRPKVDNNYRDKEGMKGKVCYDPSDPNSSDFQFADVFNSNGEKIVCGGTSP